MKASNLERSPRRPRKVWANNILTSTAVSWRTKLPWLLPISASKHQFQPRRRQENANESTTFAAVTVAKRSAREQKSGMQMKRLFPHLTLLADMRCFVAARSFPNWDLLAIEPENELSTFSRQGEWLSEGLATLPLLLRSKTRSIREIPLYFSGRLIKRDVLTGSRTHGSRFSKHKPLKLNFLAKNLKITACSWPKCYRLTQIGFNSQPFSRVCRFLQADFFLPKPTRAKRLLILLDTLHGTPATLCIVRRSLERNFFCKFPFNNLRWLLGLCHRTFLLRNKHPSGWRNVN